MLFRGIHFWVYTIFVKAYKESEEFLQMARIKIKEKKLKKLEERELEILEFINEPTNDLYDVEMFIFSMGYSDFSELPKILRNVLKSMIRDHYDSFDYDVLEYKYRHGCLYPRGFPEINVLRTIRNKIVWRLLCEKYVDYDSMSDTLLSSSEYVNGDPSITPIGADFTSKSRFERMLAAKSDPVLCNTNLDKGYCSDISDNRGTNYSVPDYDESDTNHIIEFDTSNLPIQGANMRVVNGKARYLDIVLF